MAREQGGGPFELIDPKLTIYALANGMDLVKEPGVRRLGWYREGREREIAIVAREADGDFALTVSAFRTGSDDRTEHLLDEVATPGHLLERLSALLEEGQARGNEL